MSTDTSSPPEVLPFALGLDGEPLFATRSIATAAASIGLCLEHARSALGRTKDASSAALRYHAEQARRAEDVADPRAAGWAYLVAARDPRRDDWERTLAPLAKLRGMDAAGGLVLDDDNPADWLSWLEKVYFNPILRNERVPRYVLLVGGPAYLPFGFQALLQTVANVGRVDFDCVTDLKRYVDKLVRLAEAAAPVVDREAVVFAPDHGRFDATHQSRHRMAAPLADHVEQTLRVPVTRLFDEAATKTKLADTLHARRPALVYTASHGLGAVREPLAVQQKINGGICCRRTSRTFLDNVFTADDVPRDEPFLEGAVVIQFACFGYGTPAESEFAHWTDGAARPNAQGPFVAALPRRLLAHPHGPVAYVGHLDLAFAIGFRSGEATGFWDYRMAPFKSTVDGILQLRPCGLALETMRMRQSYLETVLASHHDARHRRSGPLSIAEERTLVERWVLRGDTQNYMLFGDPGVALRLPEPANPVALP
jgi:hypothetical protein